ncbi:hypothetical protein [Paenibacillus selenitireducens]|nr:hypothetical protein [Paenibacillus selenitireducens]
MDIIVKPYGNDAGTGGVGGDCKGYCAVKVDVCNTKGADCGTRVSCLIRF